MWNKFKRNTAVIIAVVLILCAGMPALKVMGNGINVQLMHDKEMDALSASVEAGMPYMASSVSEIPDEGKGSIMDIDRFLKADGKVLKDRSGTGEVVTLRGTNIGGWQVMEAWMCPVDSIDQLTTINTLTERFGREKAEELINIYEDNWLTQKDFDYMAELNFNVLRLPISYLNLLDENGILREDTLAKYDWVVNECAERGIYVILDLHAAPGSQSGRDHSGDTRGSVLFKDEEAQKACISLWVQLAGHYKGNPVIAGYDLLNEPEGDEEERVGWGKLQLGFYDRLYKAVREVDPDHLIIIEAIWNATDMPDPSEYGWENVMYQYHFYGWDGIDEPVKQRAFTDSKVKLDKQTDFNVPVLIGEFTLFNMLSSWEHALNVYEERGWSWTTWTYKTVEMGSWGIFNSTKAGTPDVKINTDSYEEIADKWSRVSTEQSFTKNKYLFDLLRTAADGDKALEEGRRWFRSSAIETDLYADGKYPLYKTGLDASAEMDSSYMISKDNRDELMVKLTVNGEFSSASSTARNVCISPTIRDSVDASGFGYFLFEVNARQKAGGMYVTFIDKDGEAWSKGVSSQTPVISGGFEKLMVDISGMDIDKSAIIEVRVGSDADGMYYIGDMYFGNSYMSLLPEETEEELRSSMGSKGTVIDWPYEVKGGEGNSSGRSGIIIAVSGIAALAAVLVFIFFKFRKKNN